MMIATYYGKHVSESLIRYFIFAFNSIFDVLAPNMVKRVDWNKNDLVAHNFHFRRFSTNIIIASTGEDDCYAIVR